MSDLPRKPITMSLSIDEAIYPELYARLLPLGKGSRTEMMRQLAQETLVRRIAQQFAAPHSQGHHSVPHASHQAAPSAPQVAAPLAVATEPMKTSSNAAQQQQQQQQRKSDTPPSEARKTSVLPMSLLRGG